LNSAAAADNWDQHWREFTSSAELGPAHEYRRRLILNLLDFPPNDSSATMLEIGSGTGEFAERFRTLYSTAGFVGLDLSHAGVEIAARRVPTARFIQRNLLLPPDSSPRPVARYAVCSEVLEHVDDPVLLLRNATAYMAPGCKLVVTVPGGPQSAFDRHIGHRKHYTPAELRTVLEAAGFTVEAAIGAGFPFFNLYRATIILRGSKLRQDISGSPSRIVRIGMAVFGVLLRLNLMTWGWQTVAVGRLKST
jgi:2-polyprenyl-3-methyl-5-hydroxy-6-metoxy-1,4-benzoquinol methylase